MANAQLNVGVASNDRRMFENSPARHRQDRMRDINQAAWSDSRSGRGTKEARQAARETA